MRQNRGPEIQNMVRQGRGRLESVNEGRKKKLDLTLGIMGIIVQASRIMSTVYNSWPRRSRLLRKGEQTPTEKNICSPIDL